MYSLNCDYYTAEFPTLGDLRNGKGTGEMAIDFVEF